MFEGIIGMGLSLMRDANCFHAGSCGEVHFYQSNLAPFNVQVLILTAFDSAVSSRSTSTLALAARLKNTRHASCREQPRMTDRTN
jgi:hypothetical protein